MMSLRIVFVSANIVAILAQNTDLIGKSDSLVLLQEAMEVQKKRLVSISVLEVDEGPEYKLVESLSCARQPGVEVELVASLHDSTAPSSEDPVVAAPQQPENEDPPGTVAFRMALQVGIILLICDGLRKLHLQKESVEHKAGQCNQLQQGRLDTSAALAWNKMVMAARNGDEHSFNEALTQHPDVMQTDAWDCTPLHFAAIGGSTHIGGMLLKLGAETDALDAIDETPLHFAARTGGVAFCELLIKAGANINAVNKQGETPRVVAGHALQETVCHFLADSGADAGGLADTELPPLVVSQVLQKMIAA